MRDGSTILIAKRRSEALSAVAAPIPIKEYKYTELASRVPRSPREMGRRDFKNIIEAKPRKASLGSTGENALSKRNICK